MCLMSSSPLLLVMLMVPGASLFGQDASCGATAC